VREQSARQAAAKRYRIRIVFRDVLRFARLPAVLAAPARADPVGCFVADNNRRPVIDAERIAATQWELVQATHIGQRFRRVVRFRPTMTQGSRLFAENESGAPNRRSESPVQRKANRLRCRRRKAVSADMVNE
jgi:hypothetical protein